MIEEVVSVDLAVHERLTVRKNRLAPKQLTGCLLYTSPSPRDCS